MEDTNTLFGNPAAIRAAFDTGGKSVVRGDKNMLGDLLHNGGWPSQVDSSGFEVGVNMAATPGTVVYRSDLIELIQYTPQGKQVHSVQLLFCPPWINEYYIMDLATGKSLIEWAVQHGHTCFAISYRNGRPGTSRGLSTHPTPKQSTGPTRTTGDPQEWKENAEFQDGTWWQDWTEWIPNRAVLSYGRCPGRGNRRPAPQCIRVK